MTMTRTVPYNADAEEALLGAMLLSADAIRDGVAMLVPTDFHDPLHAVVFAAVAEAYGHGNPADPIAIADVLNAAEPDTAPDGGWKRYVLRLQASTYASANARVYAEIVVDRAERRRLMKLGNDVIVYAQEPDMPVEEIMGVIRNETNKLGMACAPRTFPSFEKWAATVDMTERWIVPSILERRDRVVVVAGEGHGKSTMLRAWALMAACGVHWFTETPIDPSRVLVIDVENSDRQIVRSTERMMYRVAHRARPGWDEANFTVMTFPSLDLNERADRTMIESYLSGMRPDLLVFGPIYKVFSSDYHRTYEENARRAIAVVDDWRHRFDLAVLMETHAPKGSGGHRDLMPIDSSAWLRWPEFGLTLKPDEENPRNAFLGHFRGQREVRPWPKVLERGMPGEWPWRASSAYRMQQAQRHPEERF